MASVVDLTEKLREKKEKKEIVEKFITAPQAEIDIPEVADELAQLRKRKELEIPLTMVKGEYGSWQHRFSDVRRDNSGFYILLGDNLMSGKMQVGDTLADNALNVTPYWKIIALSGGRISLEPIGTNPFLTGVGAGGAKLTQFDVGVFTGEYEKKRVEQIQAKMKTGDVRLDDVIYLLDGTMPTNMGPNGAQGGWYDASDTRSNRGGRKNMKEKEIVISDANKLKGWGFIVPISALSGLMEADEWSSWLSGNGTSDIDYVPKDLEKYIDFHRQMTQKGRWKYDELSLDRLKRDFSEEHVINYWNAVMMDVANLSKGEFKIKYPYYEKTLRFVAQALNSDLSKITKKREKLKHYFVEGEEDTEDSVIKSVFHPERRVAMRNILKLIGMAQEDSRYVMYLYDYVRMGGNDWLVNEKVINHFDLIDDVAGLKLTVENFKDPDNQRYALGYLFDRGEDDYVKKHLDGINDFQVINSTLNRVLRQEAGDRYYPTHKVKWILDYVDRNNLFNKIEASIPVKTMNSYFADDLLNTIIRSFGVSDFFEEGDQEKRNAWIKLRDRYIKERK